MAQDEPDAATRARQQATADIVYQDPFGVEPGESAEQDGPADEEGAQPEELAAGHGPPMATLAVEPSCLGLAARHRPGGRVPGDQSHSARPQVVPGPLPGHPAHGARGMAAHPRLGRLETIHAGATHVAAPCGEAWQRMQASVSRARAQLRG